MPSIFGDIPFIFQTEEIETAHAFLALNPHPWLSSLHSVHFTSETKGPEHALGADWDPIPGTTLLRALNKCVWEALSRLPALQTVYVSEPDLVASFDVDLRTITKMAGPDLARKITLRVPEIRDGICRKCGRQRHRFILPGQLDDEAGEMSRDMSGLSDAPPFGTVRTYQTLRYWEEDEDQWPPRKNYIRKLDVDACWYCRNLRR